KTPADDGLVSVHRGFNEAPPGISGTPSEINEAYLLHQAGHFRVAVFPIADVGSNVGNGRPARGAEREDGLDDRPGRAPFRRPTGTASPKRRLSPRRLVR